MPKISELGQDGVRRIFEAALDALIAIDDAGTILVWNPQAEATFGWSHQEAIGQSLAQLVIPSRHREAHQRGLERYRQTPESTLLGRRIELTALHRRGHEFPVELSITPIRMGESLAFGAFVRDITDRNRAEATLRASEERFRTLADSAPVMIWVSAPDKRCTWFNLRWLEFVGRTLEQELGKHWAEDAHPDDFAACADRYATAFDARQPFNMEYRVRRRDGMWCWILDHGTPSWSADGAFAGYLGSCIDITERRANAVAVEESQERYRTLAESLPHLVWTCLPDGWCDYLSRQWVEYTGRPEQEQLGFGWAEQLHPDDRERAQAAWASATARGDQFDIEFRIRRADGVYRWFKTRAVPLRDVSGRVMKWFGSNTDFDDHKRAEQRLETQLEQLHLLDQITRAIGERQHLQSLFDVVLRSLEESLPLDFGCVCLPEGDGDHLTVAAVGKRSAALASAVGLAEGSRVRIGENGLSRCLSGSLVHEPDTGAVPVRFAQRLAADGLHSLVLAPLLVESKVFGVLIAARSGNRGFSSTDCEFLRQLGAQVGLAAHQAQLYGALQRAYDDLRQSQENAMQHERLRALGQMAGGIAHNINNAISPISLYTDYLLEEEQGLSPRARGYLETIQRAIADVALTVAGMREFYRPPQPQLALAYVDLNDMVRQALDLTRARWSDMPQQRGAAIQVQAQLSAQPVGLGGIATEIREALTNLIFNAVDAMPEGGTLTLRTSIAGELTRVNGANSGQEVWLEVSDDGVGMDEDIRRRCLEPFVTTKGERGTGLGLAMVYGVVQRHGASIEIESQLGAGTTVRIRFPAPIEAGVQGHAEVPVLVPSRLRILVVDDDPLLVKSLRDTLETDGHFVMAASTGQSGIEIFEVACARGEPFEIVITDLGMPHVDGSRVASAVKAASPSTPVVLLTGWGQSLLAERSVPPHVDLVLSKPPHLRDLRAAFARLCPPGGLGR